MVNKSQVRAVALGRAEAELLLKNAKIIDVFTETIYEGDIAIAEGEIAGIGSYNQGKTIIDLKGAYVAPGFINAHCHVESSMTTPENYAEEELRWGVTTLITDPHEIANVAGEEGIRYMLEAGRKMPVNYYVELPSCVPATPFEHAGCTMNASDMEKLISLEGVWGMGEMMNVPGVLDNDAEVSHKLELFAKAGRVVDGHAPMVTGKELQAYVASGVDTDHESISWSEAAEKLRNGMAVLVREGSASKNLEAIITGAVEAKAATGNMAFCTDDKHLADIRREGTIRYCVKKAMELGLPVLKAIAMATINAARIYRLNRLGAVAPGYQADLVVFDALDSLRPLYVFHKGVDAWKKAGEVERTSPSERLSGSVHIKPLTTNFFDPEKFTQQEQCSVIEMLPGEIFTEHGYIEGAQVPKAVAQGELCMIAVLERHHALDFKGLGLLRGYGLQQGAIATTVGHDSHNLIVVGTRAQDMYAAVQALEKANGGYVIVKDGKVVDLLSLDIAGLMSSMKPEELNLKLRELEEKAHLQGVGQGVDPFISLSFMALPVIPKLRITDMGLFDVETFMFTK